MTLTFRDEKGSNLVAAEVDANFRDINDRLTDVEENPPTPTSIDHFVVEGTLLTIYLSNGDIQGPFVLPVASWRWTGEWAPGITYLPGDIVVESGNIYFVRVQHVSDPDFDAAAFTIDGFLYQLVLSKIAQPYDIGLYFNDLIGVGEEVLMGHVAARTFSFLANFSGSQAYLQVATSTSQIALPIYVGVALVGYITFTPGVSVDAQGGQYGTYETVDPLSGVAIAATNIITIAQPYDEDLTARGLMITMVGTVAAL